MSKLLTYTATKSKQNLLTRNYRLNKYVGHVHDVDFSLGMTLNNNKQQLNLLVVSTPLKNSGLHKVFGIKYVDNVPKQLLSSTSIESHQHFSYCRMCICST